MEDGKRFSYFRPAELLFVEEVFKIIQRLIDIFVRQKLGESTKRWDIKEQNRNFIAFLKDY